VSTTVLPEPVAAIAAGRPVRLAWKNELGGRTFEIGPGAASSGQQGCFVKWSPYVLGIDLAGEAARMRWARTYTPVPAVLAEGADETAAWIVTAPLPGTNAVEDNWIANPATAVRAIGEGLRALHERLPVACCPFSWEAQERVDWAVRAAADGRIDPDTQWHECHQHLTIAAALELAAQTPEIDRLVVCHGDSCAPNTLLTDDGRWSGHVDLGQLGVADRWADVAIATWSAGWNYGEEWEPVLLNAYGIAPDPERTQYYRLLWDLGP
jgi:aminoglycoside phosphotransferase